MRILDADADSSPVVPAVLAFAAALTTPVGEDVLAAFLSAAPLSAEDGDRES